MTNLDLLRTAVRARRAYWDAIGNLEKAIAPNGEFSDRANDAVHHEIGALAAGGEDDTTVNEGHLYRVATLAKGR
ncbi:hypothetical protein [Cupriavidus sp. TMH.W2]|uniref:hypothetical protein n=1 Tax=Cupriavidus sp. TMH.W2 TaxID=3434465 RepID=UPI003D775BC8